MTRVAMTNGMTLADLRRMADMTQLQVADRMGVSRGRVSQMEAQFPNLMFSVVQSYLAAVGGRIDFIAVGGEGFRGGTFGEDPERAEYAASRIGRTRRFRAA